MGCQRVSEGVGGEHRLSHVKATIPMMRMGGRSYQRPKKLIFCHTLICADAIGFHFSNGSSGQATMGAMQTTMHCQRCSLDGNRNSPQTRSLLTLAL
mmetsp:Transcript_66320/g.138250  ORF Transcript_66320/g.138250 Transcript_66320/m.138250 type:complete len:97 (+) Transcript_66320:194-484(+)